VADGDLGLAIRTVVRDCIAVARGEELLVVANPATQDLGERIRAEGESLGAEAVLALMGERVSHAAEPPAVIAAAMAEADAVLAPTVQSLSHTAARKAASEAGTRIATLPGVTEEMLARVMSADMDGLRQKGHAIADRLTGGTEARVTCANGSDLMLALGDRVAIPDAGELGESGAFGNLPCGEGFVAPVSGEGRLVVDGTIAAVGVPSEPVELEIADGHLISASGDDGARLMELLTEHGPDGTTIAELGIGTNEKASLTGNVLEDEKILGTAHIAFGASAAIGGTVQVPVHLDCVVMEPEVSVDGEAIVRDGKLLMTCS
jgi:leucyl aminopeptidase (aminopeptidase T)